MVGDDLPGLQARKAGWSVMTATLTAIGEVARTRPAADADPVTVAAWYEAKSALCRAFGFDEEAVHAHEHAAALLAGTPRRRTS